MKETTIIGLVLIVGTAVLIAMGKVPGDSWQWVGSAVALGKGLQGAADRFKPNGNPSTRQ